MRKNNGIPFDHYENYIMLIDEEQLSLHKELLLSPFGEHTSHDWAVLIMPSSGSMDIEIAGENYNCSVGQMVVTSLRQGIVLHNYSNDFRAKTIGMNIDFTNTLNIDNTLRSNLAVNRHPVHVINNETFTAVSLIFEQLRGIIRRDDNPYRYRALQLMVETYYYTVGYYLHQGDDSILKSNGEVLAEEFLKLVDGNFMQHRNLYYYAEKLCISEKYLSAIVRENTGNNATYWIEHRVIQYAKQRLSHSSLSVGQISDELHFLTQSHFGTFSISRMQTNLFVC